jgi:hypothetical protein
VAQKKTALIFLILFILLAGCNSKGLDPTMGQKYSGSGENGANSSVKNGSSSTKTAPAQHWNSFVKESEHFAAF